MSQHDLDLANAAGASFRSDLNLALVALGTLQSGATAPATTFAYMLWADTTAGLLKQRNAANSGWLVRGALAESFVLSRSSNTILAGADLGKAIIATAAFTQTLTAAATLGDGWFCDYNAGGFSIILDPNGAETIDGAATKTVTGSGRIYCNGSAFFTVGFGAASGAVTGSGLTMATARLLGRTTASTGAVEEISVGTGLTLSGGTLTGAGITNGTAVTPGAVTSIDFTGFPAGLKRIVINYDGLSLNSADNILVQMMVGGSAVTSGYTSATSAQQNSGTNVLASSTAGFIATGFGDARATICGSMMLSLIDTNQWVEMNASWDSSAGVATLHGGGAKTLAGAVTGIRITSVGGAATFDGGKVNIQYE